MRFITTAALVLVLALVATGCGCGPIESDGDEETEAGDGEASAAADDADEAEEDGDEGTDGGDVEQDQSKTKQFLPVLPSSEVDRTVNPRFADLGDAIELIEELVPADTETRPLRLLRFMDRLLVLNDLLQCSYEEDQLAIGFYVDKTYWYSIGLVAVSRGEVLEGATDVAFCWIRSQIGGDPDSDPIPDPHPVLQGCFEFEEFVVDDEPYNVFRIASTDWMCDELAERESDRDSVETDLRRVKIDEFNLNDSYRSDLEVIDESNIIEETEEETEDEEEETVAEPEQFDITYTSVNYWPNYCGNDADDFLERVQPGDIPTISVDGVVVDFGQTVEIERDDGNPPSVTVDGRYGWVVDDIPLAIAEWNSTTAELQSETNFVPAASIENQAYVEGFVEAPCDAVSVRIDVTSSS
ncbi:MAG: hypothetical protein AAF467_05180 [Actinomycetota bacterium]